MYCNTYKMIYTLYDENDEKITDFELEQNIEPHAILTTQFDLELRGWRWDKKYESILMLPLHHCPELNPYYVVDVDVHKD